VGGHTLLAFALMSTSCGGGSTPGTPPPTPPPGSITSVTVTPTNVNVLLGQTQQFTASVQGTGSFSNSVTWSVNDVTGGNSTVGMIDPTGRYTAPLNPPNPNTVTIKATSIAAPARSGSATVIVGSAPFHITGVAISPTSVDLGTAATQQFTATVQGTGAFDASVRWLAGGVVGGDSLHGTITSSGLYTAPEFVSSSNVTIEAVSAIDPSVKASATVRLSQGAPVINQIIPSSAPVGTQIRIQGHSFSGFTTVHFSGPNDLSLAIPLGNTLGSPTEVTVKVPLATISGPVYLQTQIQGGPLLTSNTVAFTRIPHLRIRANRHDLSSGETTQFQSRILGGDSG